MTHPEQEPHRLLFKAIVPAGVGAVIGSWVFSSGDVTMVFFSEWDDLGVASTVGSDDWIGWTEAMDDLVDLVVGLSS